MKRFLVLALVAGVLLPGSTAKSLIIPKELPSESEINDQVRSALSRNDNLEFLGRFGTKNFYLYAAIASQNTARTACATEGMKLVEFSNQDEIDFVNDRTSKDFCWTDAVINYAPTSFKWYTSGEYLSDGLSYETGDSVGLTLSVYSDATGKLSPQLRTENHCYYCYQRVL